jgi:hypothetical protein
VSEINSQVTSLGAINLLEVPVGDIKSWGMK